MTAAPAFRFMHPGEYFAVEILSRLEGPADVVARSQLAMSDEQFVEFCYGRSAFDGVLAQRLAKVAGNTPRFWLNLYRHWKRAAATAPSASRKASVSAATELIHARVRDVLEGIKLAEAEAAVEFAAYAGEPQS